MIDAKKARKLVRDYVKANPGTSFVELERLFDRHGIDWRGPLALCFPGHPSMIMWNGWSWEASDILAGLYKDHIVDFEYGPNLRMVYFIDGKMLKLPIAKSERDYVSDRWMPVVLNPGDNA